MRKLKWKRWRKMKNFILGGGLVAGPSSSFNCLTFNVFSFLCLDLRLAYPTTVIYFSLETRFNFFKIHIVGDPYMHWSIYLRSNYYTSVDSKEFTIVCNVFSCNFHGEDWIKISFLKSHITCVFLDLELDVRGNFRGNWRGISIEFLIYLSIACQSSFLSSRRPANPILFGIRLFNLQIELAVVSGCLGPSCFAWLVNKFWSSQSVLVVDFRKEMRLETFWEVV